MVQDEVDPEGQYGRSPSLLVALMTVVLVAIHIMAGYVALLGISCIFLLLAPSGKPSSKTTVTLLQIKFGWTDEDVSIIEENFPRVEETTNYELALLILWIVLFVII